MEFEKFLKKNLVEVDAFNRKVADPLNPTHIFKAISLEALGEWAYKEGFLNKGKRKTYNLGDDSYYIYRDISFACLGEKIFPFVFHILSFVILR